MVKTMVCDQLHFSIDQKPWFLPWNAAEMQFVTFDILKCLERPLSENHGCYNEMPLKWKKAMQRQLKSKSNRQHSGSGSTAAAKHNKIHGVRLSQMRQNIVKYMVFFGPFRLFRIRRRQNIVNLRVPSCPEMHSILKGVEKMGGYIIFKFFLQSGKFDS